MEEYTSVVRTLNPTLDVCWPAEAARVGENGKTKETLPSFRSKNRGSIQLTDGPGVAAIGRVGGGYVSGVTPRAVTHHTHGRRWKVEYAFTADGSNAPQGSARCAKMSSNPC